MERRLFRPLFVGGSVVVVDLVLKWLVRHVHWVVDGPYQISVGIFENMQGPFGVSSLSQTIVLSSVILLLLSVLLYRSQSATERIALVLILGGGAANFSERLFVGHVTDIFLLGSSAWNLADLSIGVGILSILLMWMRHRTRLLPSGDTIASM